MTEFERGVRFAMTRYQTYRMGVGDPVTQFGEYQMTMEPMEKIAPDSAEFRERTIKAVLHLADKEAP